MNPGPASKAMLKGNVIPLRRKNTVSQRDLLEYFLLKRELGEARKRFDDQCEYIRELLEDGADVEDGVHTAELHPFFRIVHGKDRREFLRLAVL